MPNPSPDAWAQIRYEYEHTDRPLAHICAEHGISTGTLRDRMRRWGWQRRRPLVPKEGPPAYVVIEQTPRWRADGAAAEAGGDVIGDAVGDVAGLPVPVQGSAPEAVAALPAPPRTPDNDEPSIVPQLQSAVASVLPAIEAAIAKFGDRSEYPSDIEQTARALNTMTRTLRELNALLGAHRRRW